MKRTAAKPPAISLDVRYENSVGRATGVGEDPAEGPHDLSIGGTHRAHRPDLLGCVRVEDRRQSRDAAIHDLFVDDVRLIDAPLWECLGGVLDLDRERGSLHRETRWIGKTGQRRGGVRWLL